MKKLRIGYFVLLAVFLSVLSAHAELYNRGTDSFGNQLIYDSDLNITWYDYTNIGAWQDQIDWASALTVSFGSNTYDDWRLPTTVDGTYVWGYDGSTTAGYNITSSEMGHLHYSELGNIGYYDTAGNIQSGGVMNTGDFQNLQPGYYWSGTEYADDTNSAWTFYFSYPSGEPSGSQHAANKYFSESSEYSAIAVRVGDVPQQPIAPEPISSILFVTGGTLLAGRRFIRRKA